MRERSLNVFCMDPITAGLRLKLAAAILGVDGFEPELQRLVDDKFPISAIIQEVSGGDRTDRSNHESYETE